MSSDQKNPASSNEPSRDKDDFKECLICCDRVQFSDLLPACGDCPATMCVSCGRKWYAFNRPGNVINTRRLCCPYCSCVPTSNAIHNFGNDAANAMRYLADTFYDYDIIYAWCCKCQEPRPLVERSCSRDDFKLFPQWVCMDCDILRKPELEIAEIRWATDAITQAQLSGDYVKQVKAEEHQGRVFESIEDGTMGIKPCPGCGILTQRPFECGHLHCTVDGCGIDWCYFCGQAYDKASIYQHMEEAHGDVFGGVVMDRDVVALAGTDTDSDPDFDSDSQDEGKNEDGDDDYEDDEDENDL
ncbi:hypothetical protein N7504_004358 [Penicillium tannophilum]|nr:hypothetical protein N7504_004358 [Penicillium tannophilum]